MAIKKYVLRFITALGIGCALFIVGLFLLIYPHILTDDELILAALDHELNERVREEHKFYKLHDIKTPEDFLNKFPNCCVISNGYGWKKSFLIKNFGEKEINVRFDKFDLFFLVLPWGEVTRRAKWY